MKNKIILAFLAFVTFQSHAYIILQERDGMPQGLVCGYFIYSETGQDITEEIRANNRTVVPYWLGVHFVPHGVWENPKRVETFYMKIFNNAPITEQIITKIKNRVGM